jgi:hypothetical protein
MKTSNFWKMYHENNTYLENLPRKNIFLENLPLYGNRYTRIISMHKWRYL